VPFYLVQRADDAEAIRYLSGGPGRQAVVLDVGREPPDDVLGLSNVDLAGSQEFTAGLAVPGELHLRTPEQNAQSGEKNHHRGDQQYNMSNERLHCPCLVSTTP
jgi:hypothetical protein